MPCHREYRDSGYGDLTAHVPRLLPNAAIGGMAIGGMATEYLVAKYFAGKHPATKRLVAKCPCGARYSDASQDDDSLSLATTCHYFLKACSASNCSNFSPSTVVASTP